MSQALARQRERTNAARRARDSLTEVQTRRRAEEGSKTGTPTPSPLGSPTPLRVRALTDVSARRRQSMRMSFSGSSAASTLSVAAAGDALGVRAEAVIRKQEARLEALRSETTALLFQVEGQRSELAAAQRALARRDGDVQALRTRTAELEAQLERQRQRELQLVADVDTKQKQRTGLLRSKPRASEGTFDALQSATSEVRELEERLRASDDERSVLKQQLSAVESIFIEAMAAHGIEDLQGDSGLQCIQQLLEEYDLKKEEASALQQMLADSNSQIQAAQARTLRLQETLDTIELHSLDVEAENRELLQQLEQSQNASRRHEQAVARLNEYADDITELQQALTDERARRAALAEELDQLQQQLPSPSGTRRMSVFRDKLEEGMPAADATAAEWHACAEYMHTRCKDLEEELATARRHAEREQHFLREELARREQEAEDTRAQLERQQQDYETELELVHMQLQETHQELEEQQHELQRALSDAEKSKDELSTTLGEIQSRIVDDEGEGAAHLDVLQAVEDWKEQREHRLRQAHHELASMQEELGRTSEALTQLRSSTELESANALGDSAANAHAHAHASGNPAVAALDSGQCDEPAVGEDDVLEPLLNRLKFEQAERAAAAVQQAAVAQRQLEMARRELAAVRASRNMVVGELARSMHLEKETAIRRSSQQLSAERVLTLELTRRLDEATTGLERIAAAVGIPPAKRVPLLPADVSAAGAAHADRAAQDVELLRSPLVPNEVAAAVVDALEEQAALRRHSLELNDALAQAREAQEADADQLTQQHSRKQQRRDSELEQERRVSTTQALALSQVALALAPENSLPDQSHAGHTNSKSAEIQMVAQLAGVASRRASQSQVRLAAELQQRRQLSLFSAIGLFISLVFASPFSGLVLILAGMLIALDALWNSRLLRWLGRRAPPATSPSLGWSLRALRDDTDSASVAADLLALSASFCLDVRPPLVVQRLGSLKDEGDQLVTACQQLLQHLPATAAVTSATVGVAPFQRDNATLLWASSGPNDSAADVLRATRIGASRAARASATAADLLAYGSSASRLSRARRVMPLLTAAVRARLQDVRLGSSVASTGGVAKLLCERTAGKPATTGIGAYAAPLARLVAAAASAGLGVDKNAVRVLCEFLVPGAPCVPIVCSASNGTPSAAAFEALAAAAVGSGGAKLASLASALLNSYDLHVLLEVPSGEEDGRVGVDAYLHRTPSVSPVVVALSVSGEVPGQLCISLTATAAVERPQRLLDAVCSQGKSD